ncbi:hypothetical protein KR018_005959, partial [Drosophila ironensis]
PLHYDLFLRTIVDDEHPDGVIDGNVTIRLRVYNETRTIIIGAKDLKVDPKVWMIRRVTGGRVTVNTTWQKPGQQQFGVRFNSRLWLGEQYDLTLIFNGNMSRTNRGYFLVRYKDEGFSEWLAMAQLAPNEANSVFPCFDSKNLASVNLHLAHLRNMRAVSNMPVKKVSASDSKNIVWTTFQGSPIMSVIQLAFSINRFEVKKSPKLKNGPWISSWLRPNTIDQAAYAVHLSPRLVGYFVDLFKIGYPQVKLDQLVLPDVGYPAQDFAGFVTHLESRFFVSDSSTTTAARQTVAIHLAEKFAHHWFGHLVHRGVFWMGQGLSSFLAGFAVDGADPKRRVQESDSVSKMFQVLDADSRASALPVSLAHGIGPIQTEMDAYQKSAMIFRMLHSFVGTEVFVHSLRQYLQHRGEEATNQSVLWNIFQVESDRLLSLRPDIRVSQVMESWTMQPGYPLVTVERNYEKQEVRIAQKQFLRNPLGSGRRPTDRKFCWILPLTFTSASKPSWAHTMPSDWLTCKDSARGRPLVLKEMAVAEDWIIFNLRLVTPCRITYDERNWHLIGETLAGDNATQIDRISRAQIINDVLNLATAGVVTYELAFSFLRVLKNEKDYIVWQAAARNLEWLYRQLQSTPIFPVFKVGIQGLPSSNSHAFEILQSFMRLILEEKFSNLFDENGQRIFLNDAIDDMEQFPTEATQVPITIDTASTTTTNFTEIDKDTLKTIVLQLACQTDLGACEDMAVKRFAKISLQSNDVPVDHRQTIYCTAIRFGTEADWITLRKMYDESNVASEKTFILKALACSRDNWALEKMLSWAFSGSLENKDDVHRIFSAVVRNYVGYDLAKNYLFANINKIKQIYENVTDQIVQLVGAVVDQISKDSELQSIKKFIQRDLQDLPGIEVASRRLLELGQDNIAWHRDNYNKLVTAVCNVTQSIDAQCLI